jgi:hypothetical protein
MTAMVDPLSQCADLEVEDVEDACSLEVPVNFITLHFVTSQEQHSS